LLAELGDLSTSITGDKATSGTDGREPCSVIPKVLSGRWFIRSCDCLQCFLAFCMKSHLPTEREGHDLDEMLGVLRCERCGHRLEDEIECPFCSPFQEPARKAGLPKWIYLTACFLTSPFSIYLIFRNSRLNIIEKIVASSGCLLWLAFYLS
jgi:hypothetical protein